MPAFLVAAAAVIVVLILEAARGKDLPFLRHWVVPILVFGACLTFWILALIHVVPLEWKTWLLLVGRRVADRAMHASAEAPFPARRRHPEERHATPTRRRRRSGRNGGRGE